MWACQNSHEDIVDYLVGHGADVNIHDVSSFQISHIVTIDWLLAQSADWTGLILSSRNGNLRIVKKLLDNRADVNQVTDVRISIHTVVVKLYSTMC